MLECFAGEKWAGFLSLLTSPIWAQRARVSGVLAIFAIGRGKSGCLRTPQRLCQKRKLSRNKSLGYPLKPEVNMGPVLDMTCRVMPIHLNPREATPATRILKRPNLVDEVKAHRGYYLSCALTILSAWIQARSPKSEEARSLNSFSQWSGWRRQTLLWLSRADPAERLL